jgi:hypothetical protein
MEEKQYLYKQLFKIFCGWDVELAAFSSSLTIYAKNKP